MLIFTLSLSFLFFPKYLPLRYVYIGISIIAIIDYVLYFSDLKISSLHWSIYTSVYIHVYWNLLCVTPITSYIIIPPHHMSYKNVLTIKI